MDEPDDSRAKPAPPRDRPPADKAGTREARLAAALRANLRRRKAVTPRDEA